MGTVTRQKRATRNDRAIRSLLTALAAVLAALVVALAGLSEGFSDSLAGGVGVALGGGALGLASVSAGIATSLSGRLLTNVVAWALSFLLVFGSPFGFILLQSTVTGMTSPAWLWIALSCFVIAATGLVVTWIVGVFLVTASAALVWWIALCSPVSTGGATADSLLNLDRQHFAYATVVGAGLLLSTSVAASVLSTTDLTMRMKDRTGRHRFSWVRTLGAVVAVMALLTLVVANPPGYEEIVISAMLALTLGWLLRHRPGLARMKSLTTLRWVLLFLVVPEMIAGWTIAGLPYALSWTVSSGGVNIPWGRGLLVMAMGVVVIALVDWVVLARIRWMALRQRRQRLSAAVVLLLVPLLPLYLRLTDPGTTTEPFMLQRLMREAPSDHLIGGLIGLFLLLAFLISISLGCLAAVVWLVRLARIGTKASREGIPLRLQVRAVAGWFRERHLYPSNHPALSVVAWGSVLAAAVVWAGAKSWHGFAQSGLLTGPFLTSGQPISAVTDEVGRLFGELPQPSVPIIALLAIGFGLARSSSAGPLDSFTWFGLALLVISGITFLFDQAGSVLIVALAVSSAPILLSLSLAARKRLAGHGEASSLLWRGIGGLLPLALITLTLQWGEPTLNLFDANADWFGSTVFTVWAPILAALLVAITCHDPDGVSNASSTNPALFPVGTLSDWRDGFDPESPTSIVSAESALTDLDDVGISTQLALVLARSLPGYPNVPGYPSKHDLLAWLRGERDPACLSALVPSPSSWTRWFESWRLQPMPVPTGWAVPIVLQGLLSTSVRTRRDSLGDALIVSDLANRLWFSSLSAHSPEAILFMTLRLRAALLPMADRETPAESLVLQEAVEQLVSGAPDRFVPQRRLAAFFAPAFYHEALDPLAGSDPPMLSGVDLDDLEATASRWVSHAEMPPATALPISPQGARCLDWMLESVDAQIQPGTPVAEIAINRTLQMIQLDEDEESQWLLTSVERGLRLATRQEEYHLGGAPARYQAFLRLRVEMQLLLLLVSETVSEPLAISESALEGARAASEDRDSDHWGRISRALDAVALAASDAGDLDREREALLEAFGVNERRFRDHPGAETAESLSVSIEYLEWLLEEGREVPVAVVKRMDEARASLASGGTSNR